MRWLLAAFGPGVATDEPPDPRLAGLFPPDLLELYARGPTAYGEGLLCVIDPFASFPPDPEVPGLAFAHNAFGDVFSWDDGVYVTLAESGTSMFQSDEVDTFFQGSLGSRGFVDSVLQKRLFTRILRRLGPLRPGQVYVPVPLPALGGSGAPESYAVGALPAVVELYRQVR